MMEERSLLFAIAADPGDDTVRLAYADFLEEKGQTERAAFIRNQVELARFDINDPARHPWIKRNLNFLSSFGPAWKAELPHIPGVSWGDFNRGLVEEVLATSEQPIVQHAARIFAEPALHILRLARLNSGGDLAELPELARVRSLRLISARAGSAAIERMLASEYLAQLVVLELDRNETGDRGAAAIARTPLPSLEELWLGQNDIRDSGAQALADSPHLQRLRLLDLRGNWIERHEVRVALLRRFGSRVKL
jgi:uncharacterized protein (TIGR02996 family)